MIWDVETPIWIYGFGARGRSIEMRLAQQGIKIRGFIDRNPERYARRERGARILRPSEVKPASNAVAVCSVTNVFTHSEIAEMLAQKGFLYVIYKCFGDTPAERKIDALYENLTSIFETGSVFGKEIPAYMDLAKRNAEQGTGSSGTVCVNVPTELLFGLTKDYFRSSLLFKDENLLSAIPEKSLLYYTSPQKMMQYFEGGVDETVWERCKALWFACRNAQSFSSPLDRYSDEEQNRSLEERYAIFQQMNQLFCQNPSFFKNNPISVVWNENGFFNIQDGNNRAAFLLAHGLDSIPAKMSAADYDVWTRDCEAVREVENALQNVELQLRSPILHPKLQHIPCALALYSHRKVASLCDWLWRQQIDPNGLSVCEYYCTNDLCGSHLARMGGTLTVIDVEEQVILHRALDKLYRLNNVCYHRDRQNSFQILLANGMDAWEKLAVDNLQAEWYIFEFVDIKDAEIAALAAHISTDEPEYLARYLVGSNLCKVVAIRGRRS